MCFSFLRTIHKKHIAIFFRSYSYEKFFKNVELDRIRNIGILAHIDAGKTTTTERMLYYAGVIKQTGEVHRGNTVTDYMAQERERGITIRSAAVTFVWNNHQINLIDTPGHIDFTMEVEQTLNVLDGAVVVLDGSAGVEAQTQTVWFQADRYKVPRIIFVNKMDRNDADYDMCCQMVEKKLDIRTLKLQIPVIENYKIKGVIDVLTFNQYIWYNGILQKTELNSSVNSKVYEKVQDARNLVIDTLANYDDTLAEKVIKSGSYKSVLTTDIVASLQKVVLMQKVVPAFCGSAYKNIGIEPLIDAVLLYLPAPSQRNDDYKYFENNLCARAFKIIHDKQKGAITSFRIHSGNFIKGQKIFNIQQNMSEQTSRLYITFADEYQEIEQLSNGNIAAITGLKHTRSGDLITNSANTLAAAKKKLSMLKKSSKQNEDSLENVFGKGPKIPEAVFFCSIEPPSLSKQAALEHALSELQREDPSLRVGTDNDTGQIILGGMGELHLEIIRDRILKEYKVETQLGPLQIAYRESPLEKISCDLATEMKVGNNKQTASISLSVIPVEKDVTEKNLLTLDRKPEAASNISSIFPKHLAAVRHGIEVGLLHGPKLGSKVINVQVMLHLLNVVKGTTEFVIEATATQCVQKALKQSGTCILEPIMYLEIIVPEEHTSGILADLSRRRAAIQNVGIRGCNKIVTADVPLSELLGYSTSLRTISSGSASFSMEFVEYKRMSPIDESKAIESVRGF